MHIEGKGRIAEMEAPWYFRIQARDELLGVVNRSLSKINASQSSKLKAQKMTETPSPVKSFTSTW
jgi:hypothetical protein